MPPWREVVGHEATSNLQERVARTCAVQRYTRSGRRPHGDEGHTHKLLCSKRWRKPHTHTRTHTASPYCTTIEWACTPCPDTLSVRSGVPGIITIIFRLRRVTFYDIQTNYVTNLHAACNELYAAALCRALRSGALDQADHDEAAPRWRSAGCAVWLGLVPEAWHHPLSSSTPARPPCSSFCSQSASLQPSVH